MPQVTDEDQNADAATSKDSVFLREITPRNFLSFGPETAPIALGPLNVLIGANGSGKSNLIETLVQQALAASGNVKGFKRHVTAFVGYLIAHKARHRGQIEWALKSAGHPLDDKVSYGLWEWGVR